MPRTQRLSAELSIDAHLTNGFHRTFREFDKMLNRTASMFGGTRKDGVFEKIDRDMNRLGRKDYRRVFSRAGQQMAKGVKGIGKEIIREIQREFGIISREIDASMRNLVHRAGGVRGRRFVNTRQHNRQAGSEALRRAAEHGRGVGHGALTAALLGVGIANRTRRGLFTSPEKRMKSEFTRQSNLKRLAKHYDDSERKAREIGKDTIRWRNAQHAVNQQLKQSETRLNRLAKAQTHFTAQQRINERVGNFWRRNRRFALYGGVGAGLATGYAVHQTARNYGELDLMLHVLEAEGVKRNQIPGIRDKVLKYSEVTKFTPNEIVDVLVQMKKDGHAVSEELTGVWDIMKLAIAESRDLPEAWEATRVLINTTNTELGDALKLQRQLSNATSLSAAKIEDLRYVSARSLSTFNQIPSWTSAAYLGLAGILKDAGLHNEPVATGLRNFAIILSEKASAVRSEFGTPERPQQIFDKYFVRDKRNWQSPRSVVDKEGNLRPVEDILKVLEYVFKESGDFTTPSGKFADAKAIGTIVSIFQREAMPIIMNLLGQSERLKKNVEKINDPETLKYKSQVLGMSIDFAKKRWTNALSALMNRLYLTIDNEGLFNKFFTMLATMTTQVSNWLQRHTVSIQRGADAVIFAIRMGLSGIEKVARKFFDWLLPRWGDISNAFVNIWDNMVGAFRTAKPVIQAVLAVLSALFDSITAFLNNPVGGGIVGWTAALAVGMLALKAPIMIISGVFHGFMGIVASLRAEFTSLGKAITLIPEKVQRTQQGVARAYKQTRQAVGYFPSAIRQGVRQGRPSYSPRKAASAIDPRNMGFGASGASPILMLPSQASPSSHPPPASAFWRNTSYRDRAERDRQAKQQQANAKRESTQERNARNKNMRHLLRYEGQHVAAGRVTGKAGGVPEVRQMFAKGRRPLQGSWWLGADIIAETEGAEKYIRKDRLYRYHVGEGYISPQQYRGRGIYGATKSAVLPKRMYSKLGIKSLTNAKNVKKLQDLGLEIRTRPDGSTDVILPGYQAGETRLFSPTTTRKSKSYSIRRTNQLLGMRKTDHTPGLQKMGQELGTLVDKWEREDKQVQKYASMKRTKQRRKELGGFITGAAGYISKLTTEEARILESAKKQIPGKVPGTAGLQLHRARLAFVDRLYNVAEEMGADWDDLADIEAWKTTLQSGDLTKTEKANFDKMVTQYHSKWKDGDLAEAHRKLIGKPESEGKRQRTLSALAMKQQYMGQDAHRVVFEQLKAEGIVAKNAKMPDTPKKMMALVEKAKGKWQREMTDSTTASKEYKNAVERRHRTTLAIQKIWEDTPGTRYYEQKQKRGLAVIGGRPETDPRFFTAAGKSLLPANRLALQPALQALALDTSLTAQQRGQRQRRLIETAFREQQQSAYALGKRSQERVKRQIQERRRAARPMQSMAQVPTLDRTLGVTRGGMFEGETTLGVFREGLIVDDILSMSPQERKQERQRAKRLKFVRMRRMYEEKRKQDTLRTALKGNRRRMLGGLGGGLLDIATLGLGGVVMEGLKERKAIKRAGTALVPAGAKRTAGFWQKITGTFGKRAAGAAATGTALVPVTQMSAALVPVVTVIGKVVASLGLLGATLIGITTALVGIGLIAHLNTVWDFFKNFGKMLWEFGRVLFEGFMFIVDVVFRPVGNVLAGIGKGIWSAVKTITSPIKWLFDGLSWLAERFTGWFDRFANFLGKKREERAYNRGGGENFSRRDWGDLSLLEQARALDDISAQQRLPGAHQQLQEDIDYWIKTGNMSAGLLGVDPFGQAKTKGFSPMKDLGLLSQARLLMEASNKASAGEGFFGDAARKATAEANKAFTTPTDDLLSGRSVAPSRTEYINMKGIDDLISIVRAGFQELVNVNRMGFGLVKVGEDGSLETENGKPYNVVINVYQQPGEDGEALARKVVDVLNTDADATMIDTE